MYEPRWHLELVTAPSVEPLSVPEAKAHCRVTTNDDDDYIADLITLAREYVELNIHGGRQLCTATWDQRLDCFPCGRSRLELPKPPLQSVTSVTYYDAANASTVMPSSDYVVTTPDSLPGSIQPAIGATWPSVSDRDDAIVIRFIAGYGNASTVPMRAKHAIKLLVGTWYDNRESVAEKVMPPVPHGVDELLNSLGWGYVL